MQFEDKRAETYKKSAYTKRVYTYAKRLISMYELDYCLPFVVVLLKILNSLNSKIEAIQVKRQYVCCFQSYLCGLLNFVSRDVTLYIMLTNA